MSTLTLVRHGQASFFKEDYDQLSPLGEQQSIALGKYWSANARRFDRMIIGPRKRHAQTALALRLGWLSDIDLPQMEYLSEWDEYRAEDVMQKFLPILAEREPEIARLRQIFNESESPKEKIKAFQKLFEDITQRWVKGELIADEIESWEEFVEKVQRGVNSVIAQAEPDHAIVVFTSGGTIAATVQKALALTPEKTLELSWMSYNASYTEFSFSPRRFILSGFNHTPHLSDSTMLSYR